jgi:Uma2 family endonuclease
MSLVVHVVPPTGGPDAGVPRWVVDLASFRRWFRADDFPEEGRIWYLKGGVWVDMNGEQVFTHVLVKTEINGVLSTLVKLGGLGLFLADGAQLVNADADLSCRPDATFVTSAGLQDRVRLIEGSEEGYVELEGSPDMVLEVVSRSSVNKDNVQFRQAYWEAGIREYWLVDARREPLKFDILRHTARGYAATPHRDGWVKSAVFGKSFQLTQQTNALGHPEYTLAVR